jgi:A/G-specific adenine glycosylase
MDSISSSRIKSFQEKIFNWWKSNRREFPWRQTTDPYKILVSEIMLQQTQASRVVEKYNEFINKYPSLENLASATGAQVLKIWSGLGYNRRALWLLEASKEIMEMKQFPKTSKDLEELKGIGPYTSRAILIFAFNKDVATVDTNIRRIFIHEGFAIEETTDEELFTIANRLLPKGQSRDWHNALMDYGAEKITAKKTGIRPPSKQSSFKNSSRMFRGAIVKYLIKNSNVNDQKIANECQIPKEELDDILSSLIKDGLIVRSGTKYSLPENE